MIILNNKGKYLWSFNGDEVWDRIFRLIILRRAYKGYVYYNTLEDKNASYHSFAEFKKFELWKIRFSFQIYLERLKNVPSLGFNPYLFKYILK